MVTITEGLQRSSINSMFILYQHCVCVHSHFQPSEAVFSIRSLFSCTLVRTLNAEIRINAVISFTLRLIACLLIGCFTCCGIGPLMFFADTLMISFIFTHLRWDVSVLQPLQGLTFYSEFISRQLKTILLLLAKRGISFDNSMSMRCQESMFDQYCVLDVANITVECAMSLSLTA